MHTSILAGGDLYSRTEKHNRDTNPAKTWMIGTVLVSIDEIVAIPVFHLVFDMGGTANCEGGISCTTDQTCTLWYA